MRVKNIVLVGAFIFASMLFAPVVVLAQERPAADIASENTAEAIKQRVEKRKTELKTKIDKAEETRLKARCKAAQAILTKAKTRSEEVEKRRIGHYEKLSERINTLITKLKAANMSTTDLETAGSAYALKVQELATSYDTYQQALSDASAIDCVVDPTGFKASLENARTLHASIGKSYASVRKDIADSLLPAINAAKQSINTAKTDQNGESGE